MCKRRRIWKPARGDSTFHDITPNTISPQRRPPFTRAIARSSTCGAECGYAGPNTCRRPRKSPNQMLSWTAPQTTPGAAVRGQRPYQCTTRLRLADHPMAQRKQRPSADAGAGVLCQLEWISFKLRDMGKSFYLMLPDIDMVTKSVPL